VNILLWLVQILLACAFGMAGVMKSTQPVDVLAANGIAWAPQLPLVLVRFIGISEFLGAVGLILPALTKVKPFLTPLAALGLLTIMILAMGFHVSRGEAGALPANIVLGGLAAFVAWGRTSKAPIR
jgi:putative oxidoreductase